ncbi:unnamed protein product [Urochloa humidicola]
MAKSFHQYGLLEILQLQCDILLPTELLSTFPFLIQYGGIGVRQNAPMAFEAAERGAPVTKAAAPVAPVQAPNLLGLWLSTGTVKVAAWHKCTGKQCQHQTLQRTTAKKPWAA